MDSDVLSYVAKPHLPPIYQKASIKNFAMKLWGPYPTLIPATSTSTATSSSTTITASSPPSSDVAATSAAQDETSTLIHGRVWEVTSAAQFRRLAAYETDKYTCCPCDVVLEESGEKVDNCWTFCWAGDAGSAELADGVFELWKWQRDFKPRYLKRFRGV